MVRLFEMSAYWRERHHDVSRDGELLVFPRPNEGGQAQSGEQGLRFEYKTICLHNGASAVLPGGWADILNGEAELGWRVVTVDAGIALLERGLTKAYPESA